MTVLGWVIIIKNKLYTCCFFGHRKINEADELKNNLNRIIENLIINEKINTFLFGSKSEFNDLCLNVVTQLKMKYPYIKRVYVRAEYPYIDEDYKNYLLEHYEETYYPEKILNAGKAAYVERNCEMIDSSSICVVYYDESYIPKRKNSKSGTKIAYDYAVKKGAEIINVYDMKKESQVNK